VRASPTARPRLAGPTGDRARDDRARPVAGARDRPSTRGVGEAADVEVHAPEGAVLRGLVVRSASPRGTVVVQTPYDARAHESMARGWAGAGWTCVVVDVRGRYRSDGPWEAYRDESHDGLSLLRDLLCSGHLSSRETDAVVLAGASYAGMCALTTARRAFRDDPTVAARLRGLVLTVPVTGAWESAHDPSGLPRLRQRLGWWSTHGAHRRSVPGPGAETLERWAQGAGGSRDMSGVLARLGAPGDVARAWARLWRAEPTVAEELKLPLMLVSGAHDHFSAEAEALVRSWSPRVPAVFISGPWDHTLRLRRHLGPWEDLDAVRSTIAAPGPVGAHAVRWLQHLDREPPAGLTYRTLDTGATSWQADGTPGTGWVDGIAGGESGAEPVPSVEVHARLVLLPADVPLDLPAAAPAAGTTLRVDLELPAVADDALEEGAGWVRCEVHELRDGHRRTVLRRSLPLRHAAARGEVHGLRVRLRSGSRAVLHVRGPTAFR
jgi:uncharacterized protein